MTRLYFESPVHVVSPKDSASEDHRRKLIPVRRVMLGGLVAIALTLGAAGLQRYLAAAPPPPIEASREQAARQGRLMAIFLTDDASEAALRMEQESFTDAAVDRVLSRRFVCRFLNASNPTDLEFAQRYDMATPPTLVLTAPDGTVLRRSDGQAARHVGHLGPAELRAFLTDAVPPSKRKTQRPVVSLRDAR